MRKYIKLFLVLILLIIVCFSIQRIGHGFSKNSINDPQKYVEIDLAGNKDINHEKIEEANADYLYWINIPGTNIVYPVMQYNDNDYYLHHSYDKRKNALGSIFLDYRSTSDLTDSVTMIYGHNVDDSYIFGGLKQFKATEYQQSHQLMQLSNQDHTYIYEFDTFYQVESNEVMPTIIAEVAPNQQKVALITCSYESGKGMDTTSRYIVFWKLKEII